MDYTIVYQIILFLILWAILSKVLFHPYLALLDERERKTAGALREASDLEREGERLRVEYEEKIAQAQAAGYAAREAVVNEASRQREKTARRIGVAPKITAPVGASVRRGTAPDAIEG